MPRHMRWRRISSFGTSSSTCPWRPLADVFTFWEAELRVVSGLKARVLDEAQTVDVEAIAAVVASRKAGHWLAGPGRDAVERRAVRDAYDAILAPPSCLPSGPNIGTR